VRGKEMEKETCCARWWTCLCWRSRLSRLKRVRILVLGTVKTGVPVIPM
jgi:hypothetical protein